MHFYIFKHEKYIHTKIYAIIKLNTHNIIFLCKIDDVVTGRQISITFQGTFSYFLQQIKQKQYSNQTPLATYLIEHIC